jgi:hypothetical protein
MRLRVHSVLVVLLALARDFTAVAFQSESVQSGATGECIHHEVVPPDTLPPVWTQHEIVLANDTDTSTASLEGIHGTENTTSDDPKQRRRRKFERVFEQLRDELMEYMSTENMPSEAVAWFRRVRLSLLLGGQS